MVTWGLDLFDYDFRDVKKKPSSPIIVWEVVVRKNDFGVSESGAF